MFNLRNKYIRLYLTSLGLLLPVAFQLGFISISLYVLYTSYIRFPYSSNIIMVLISLMIISNDIILYCMKRIEAEGYNSGYFCSQSSIPRYCKILIFIAIYLLPMGYILSESSSGFLFWAFLLLGSARLATYYVVREAEQRKIESFLVRVRKGRSS